MEDNGRGLDPDPVNTHPAKEGRQSSKELTIMVIGSVGKMRSFKLSRKFIWCASTFFLIYIIISLFVIYLYFDLYEAHKDQAGSLKNLEVELSEKIKTLEDNKLYIKGLEEFFNANRKETEDKPDKNATRKITEGSGKSKVTAPAASKSKEPEKKKKEGKANTAATRKKTTESAGPEVTSSAASKSQEPEKKKAEEKADTGTTRKKTHEPVSAEVTASGDVKTRESEKKKTEEKADTGTVQKKTTEPAGPEVTSSIASKSQEPEKKKAEEKADTGTTRKKTPEPVTPEEISSAASKNQETEKTQIEENSGADTSLKETPESASPETSIPGETESKDTVQSETVEEPMGVEEVKFRKSDSELILDFKLINNRAEQKTAEGYIHIIVMDKDKECPPEWNSSYNKLSDGFPVNYKHGQQFLIQRFRPYQRQYKANPDSELPSFIRIMVYDQSGQKMFEKEYPVIYESTNETS